MDVVSILDVSAPHKMVFWLFASHMLCDYPLQSEFMAKGKDPANSPYFGVPWYWTMSAHCLTHAAGVAFILNNVLFGMAEFCSHFVIDYLKCKKVFGADTDQTLHLSFMLLWTLIFWISK